ncbi:MAG TPA: hypothetical protein VJ813_05050 [Vicinamibacterales bacterium]|nr:hypothetical protein [Vicinamibacterales bacterium]
MRISVEEFQPEHEAAVAAFNQRMRSASAPSGFLLPLHAKPPVRDGSVTVTHYVAVDEARQVRGGMMCQAHPAVAGSRVDQAVNVQAPLSEGIIDPAFTFVAPQLIKHALRLSALAFVVGMGSARNPLPRLLKAMGWSVDAVPFYFRLLRGARCARHLAPLRTTAAKRMAADLAAMTGAASLAPRLAHRVSPAAKQLASQYQVAPVERWLEWTEAAWEAFARDLSFGVLRTAETLPFFYRFDDRSPRAWTVERNGRVEGWFGLKLSAMSNNEYFGDLVVATLTDCVGTADAVRAGVAVAARTAHQHGADLLITNQQHRLLQDACAAAGWRQGPSNFLFAASRALAATFQPGTVHITRRDGDGLINLGG